MRYLMLFFALLALTSSARAEPPDWGTARDIEIRLSGQAFTPPRIALKHGEAVRLVLINDRAATRSFHAPDFFNAATEMPDADRALLRKGGVLLKPGETVTLRVAAPAVGEYRMRSGRLLQAALGMTGQIVVR